MEGVDAGGIKSRIETYLDCEVVEISAVGCCDNSFEALVVSKEFCGKNLLAKQRLVFAALKHDPNLMDCIHAFKFRGCLTPEEFQKTRAKEAEGKEKEGN